jgi:hypothetical protein
MKIVIAVIRADKLEGLRTTLPDTTRILSATAVRATRTRSPRALWRVEILVADESLRDLADRLGATGADLNADRPDGVVFVAPLGRRKPRLAAAS